MIGRDEATDLAVIKVEGADFPFVDFENSAKPRVGDWVIAVGNPFGLGGTATAGIVSAYGRNIGDNFVDYIQIDAPINRGNSGGPTFDIYGRVIGVNTAIFSPSGGSVGIGFAIPADVADSDHQAADRRRQDHPRLYRRDDPGRHARDRRQPGHERQEGRAGRRPGARRPGRRRPGVMPGDVVVDLNGHAVGSATELTRAGRRPASRRHPASVGAARRQAEDHRRHLRHPPAAERAGGQRQQRRRRRRRPRRTRRRAEHPTVLGMTLGPLDAATRGHLGLPADVRGAVVLAVKGSSDAGDKGMKAGDIIVRAGDSNVASPADVVAAVASAKKAGRTSILLGIHRDGVTRFAADQDRKLGLLEGAGARAGRCAS